MNKYLKGLGFIFITIILLNSILTIFYYNSILNSNLLDYLKIIILPISIFIGGLYLGNKVDRKGYLEGLKLGLSFFLLLVIVSIIIKNIAIKNIIYYFSLIISSICGSMVGINKRKN